MLPTGDVSATRYKEAQLCSFILVLFHFFSLKTSTKVQILHSELHSKNNHHLFECLVILIPSEHISRRRFNAVFSAHSLKSNIFSPLKLFVMVSFSPYSCILLEVVESQGFSSCCHGEDDHAAFTEATTSSRFPRVSAASVCARVRVCCCRGVIVNPAPRQIGDNSFSFGENHTFTSCTDRM